MLALVIVLPVEIVGAVGKLYDASRDDRRARSGAPYLLRLFADAKLAEN